MELNNLFPGTSAVLSKVNDCIGLGVHQLMLTISFDSCTARSLPFDELAYRHSQAGSELSAAEADCASTAHFSSRNDFCPVAVAYGDGGLPHGPLLQAVHTLYAAQLGLDSRLLAAECALPPDLAKDHPWAFPGALCPEVLAQALGLECLARCGEKLKGAKPLLLTSVSTSLREQAADSYVRLCARVYDFKFRGGDPGWLAAGAFFNPGSGKIVAHAGVLCRALLPR